MIDPLDPLYFLSLTPAQFKRVRANFRLLTRRFHMPTDRALQFLHATMEIEADVRAAAQDERMLDRANRAFRTGQVK